MGIISRFLDLLFPPRCAFCHRFLEHSEHGLCAECIINLPYTEPENRKTGEHFSACVAPVYYEKTVRDSVHRFKFKEATGYARIYGGLMSQCIRQRLKGSYDLITWVPLSEKRLKSRGYDQAMLLAMAVALELEDVAVETLYKFKDVKAQSATGGAVERQANISGAYRAPDPELIAGRRILLIDDVVTTGSTLSECAKTLREAGASDVVCCALAQTRD